MARWDLGHGLVARVGFILMAARNPVTVSKKPQTMTVKRESIL